MPRKINFFDGIISGLAPTIGNLVASSLSIYADDAAYEAAELGSPVAGNFYYNSTLGKLRYYDALNGLWKDVDAESLSAIATLIAEQGVQDGLISQNSADIAIINTALTQINTDISDLETEINDSIRQNQNLATVGGGDIRFNSAGSGDPVIIDQNSNNTVSTSFLSTDEAGFTFTPQNSGILNDLEIIVDAGTATIGDFTVSVWETGATGLPTSQLEVSTPINISSLNPSGTPTPLTINFSGTNELLQSIKYAFIFTPNGLDGSILASKDDQQLDSDGEILYYNVPAGAFEVSSETNDMYFIINGTATSIGSGVNIEEDMYIQVPGMQDTSNTIPAQTFELANGEIAYVVPNRTNDVPTQLNLTITTISNLTVDDSLIVARRIDDVIYVGKNHTISLTEGQFGRLDELGAGGSGGAKGRRIIGDADISLSSVTSSNFNKVYGQVEIGSIAVTIPTGNSWGGAYFLNTNTLTNLSRVTVKLWAIQDNAGTVTLQLVEADSNGKPLVSNVVANFPSVDVTTINNNVDVNGTNVTLDSTATFTLNGGQNYAFIYDNSTVTGTGSTQVAMFGIDEAGLVGAGMENAGDINDVNDWDAAAYTGGADHIALSLFESSAPTSELTLDISDDIYFQTEGLADDRNTISAQQLVFSDDRDVAYFIPNLVDTASVVPVTVSNISSVPDNGVMFASRNGDNLIFGCPQTINMVDGDSYNLAENIGGASGSSVDVDDKIGIVHEVFSQGQGFGPSSVAGSLTKRLLSSVHKSTTWMSLDIANNRITLQPGVYKVNITAPALGVAGHRVYLMEYNGGALSKVLKSSNAHSNSATTTARADQTHAIINDTLTVSVATEYEVHHLISSAGPFGSTIQMGYFVNESGESEIYTSAMFEKLGEITNNVTYSTTVNGTVLLDPDDTYYRAEEQQPAGVDGGTNVIGGNTRNINTVISSTTWATLNVDGTTTVTPGKYEISCFSTGYRCGRNRLLIIYSDTGTTGTVLDSGSSDFCGTTNNNVKSFTNGYFVFNEDTTLELRHQMDVVTAVSGLGVYANVVGLPEVYAQIVIKKVGDI